MRRKYKIRIIISACIILFMLPYIITMALHGSDLKKTEIGEAFMVKVKTEDETIELPWSEYITGVLALATSGLDEKEFLKAQAVLTRTKLYQQLEESEDKVFTEAYLTERDIEAELGNVKGREYYDKLQDAVLETGNQVLVYQGKYAWVPFHYSSNGTTRDAKEVMGTEDYPYLKVKECPLDKKAEDEIQVTTYTYREIQKKCQPFLVAVSEKDADKTYKFDDFQIVSYDSAGYVAQMKIGETTCTGDQFRDALDLASGTFQLTEKSDGMSVTTIGRGHGLGMSQWTACEMAKDDKKYDEILQYFFEGTTLESGGEIFTKTE